MSARAEEGAGPHEGRVVPFCLERGILPEVALGPRDATSIREDI